jgi:membrane protein implicated in regulation of membrane protease activity
MPVYAQWIAFIVTSALYLALLRRKLTAIFALREKGRGDSLKDPLVAEGYIGREVVVVEAISPDKGGTVELNGSIWQARCGVGIDKGAVVMVTEVKDLILWVRPL